MSHCSLLLLSSAPTMQHTQHGDSFECWHNAKTNSACAPQVNTTSRSRPSTPQREHSLCLHASLEAGARRSCASPCCKSPASFHSCHVAGTVCDRKVTLCWLAAACCCPCCSRRSIQNTANKVTGSPALPPAPADCTNFAACTKSAVHIFEASATLDNDALFFRPVSAKYTVAHVCVL